MIFDSEQLKSIMIAFIRVIEMVISLVLGRSSSLFKKNEKSVILQF